LASAGVGAGRRGAASRLRRHRALGSSARRSAGRHYHRAAGRAAVSLPGEASLSLTQRREGVKSPLILIIVAPSREIERQTNFRPNAMKQRILLGLVLMFLLPTGCVFKERQPILFLIPDGYVG